MILTTDKTAAEQEQENAYNQELLVHYIKSYIRDRFDKTVLQHTAESWITIAKEQGFNDLATEMESDLQTELLTA